MRRVITYTWLVGVLAAGVHAAEVIKKGPWQARCDKGEVVELSCDGITVLTKIGNVRVAGRDAVRPFRDATTLREKQDNQLVYEGISDDGKHLYVEFGQIAAVDSDFEFMIFTYWLPPDQWPPDAVTGLIEFSPEVKSVKQVPAPGKESAVQQTLNYLVELDNGKQLRMRTLYLDREKIELTRTKDNYQFRFEGSHDYRKYPSRPKHGRSMYYYMCTTDTSYVKFIFSREKETK